jgi:hypothetical protein
MSKKFVPMAISPIFQLLDSWTLSIARILNTTKHNGSETASGSAQVEGGHTLLGPLERANLYYCI